MPPGFSNRSALSRCENLPGQASAAEVVGAVERDAYADGDLAQAAGPAGAQQVQPRDEAQQLRAVHQRRQHQQHRRLDLHLRPRQSPAVEGVVQPVARGRARRLQRPAPGAKVLQARWAAAEQFGEMAEAAMLHRLREMQKATPLARHLTGYFLRNDVGLSEHFREELETYLRGIAGALAVPVIRTTGLPVKPSALMFFTIWWPAVAARSGTDSATPVARS